jgi:hypothetical protein
VSVTAKKLDKFHSRRGPRHWTHRHPERVPRGQDHGRALLTEAQVKKIRACKGSFTAQSVADLYGVTRPCVYAIWGRITWTHVPELAASPE